MMGLEVACNWEMTSDIDRDGGAASQAAMAVSWMDSNRKVPARQEMSNNSASAPTLLEVRL